MNKTILNIFLISALIFLPLGIYVGYLIAGYLNKNSDSLVSMNTEQNLNTSQENNTPTIPEINVSDDKNMIENSMQLPETDDIKGLGYTGQQKVVINSKGNIYVAYRQKYESDYEIFVAEFIKSDNAYNLNKESIRKPISIIGNNSTQRVPSIAIDPNDNLYVTWYGLDSNNEDLGRQIKFSMSTDSGKTWTKAKNISIVEGYKKEDYWQEHPQITVKNNNLFIVWEGKDANNEEQQIKFSRSTNGGQTWSKWKNIYETSDNTQSRPNIIIDNNENLNLFFYSSYDSDQQQVWHSISNNDGTTWSKPQKINSNDLDSRHIGAVSFDNKIMATWRAGNSNNRSQIFFSIFQNNTWSEPQMVFKSEHYQMFPSIGINRNGIPAIAWVESSSDSKFPRDDPEKSIAYISAYNKNLNKFENKTQISNSNTQYPQLINTNSFDNNFYTVYSAGNEAPFKINLKDWPQPE